MWSFTPDGAQATVALVDTAGEERDGFPALHRTARFVIRGDIGRADAAQVGAWLEQVAEVFDAEARALGFEPRAIAAPLTVVFLRDRETFITFARERDLIDASRMGGYYAPAGNRVVLYDDRSTESFAAALASPDPAERAAAARDASRATRRKIAHEAAHLLAFNTGVQERGVEYPGWFTEGLAERVAARAMNEAPRASRGDAWARAMALAFSTDPHARYAAAHAAFEALASRGPGAVSGFAAAISDHPADDRSRDDALAGVRTDD